MTQPAGDYEGLNGVRAPVVEDDPALRMDLEWTLAEAGAVVVGLCRTLKEGLARSDSVDFAVAVLDCQLDEETVLPLARRLLDRGVPFVLHTGRPRSDPAWRSGVPAWRSGVYVRPSKSRRLRVSSFRRSEMCWRNSAEDGNFCMRSRVHPGF
jgi:hypothetical protein